MADSSNSKPVDVDVDIVVIGRGAIGNLLAARLSVAGLKVCQVSAGLNSGERLLRVFQEGKESWETYVCGESCLREAGAEKASLIVLACKATQVWRYLHELDQDVFSAVPVVVACNGLVDFSTLSRPVFPAVVKATADTENGTVTCHAFHEILAPESVLQDAASGLRSALEDAGFHFTPAEIFLVEKFLKLTLVTTGARMTLANLSIGETLIEPDVRADSAEVIRESGNILAGELPQNLRNQFVDAYRNLAEHFRAGTLLSAAQSPMINAFPSLHRDLEQKRETEVDYLNGAIVECAARSGKEAPLNRFLADEVRRMTRLQISPTMVVAARDTQERLNRVFSERVG